MRRRLLFLTAALMLSACSKDSPTAPSQTQPPTQTPPPTFYTITGTVSSAAGGTLAGATVRVGDGPNAGMSAQTDGSGRYTLSGLTFAGFTVTASAPGHVDLSRGGLLSQNSTTSTVNWTLLPATVFSRSGVGATVFDVPTYITRVQITASYGGRCENFIVRIGGRLLVNEILGTCSVATSGATFSGSYTTTGGVAEVTSSSGINWTIREMR